MNRRGFLTTALACSVARGQTSTGKQGALPEAIRKLRPMTAGVQPITDQERAARIEKARRLMRENKIGALLMEAGTSMYYFTGKRAAGASWVLPARGEPIWIAAAAQAAVAGEVRVRKEPGSEFALIAQAFKDRGVSTGKIGVEEQVLFGVFDGVRRQAQALEFVSATPVTAGCRMIKSAAEIALLQHANDVTIEAYRAGLATLYEGIPQNEFADNIQAAYRALGYAGAVGVTFGKYTAFPHGSIVPQKLREGDVVMIDDGVRVEGYQADITRTTVFGKATNRQREIWNLERRAQDAALAAARPGNTCESVDAAARKVISDFGFGPDYKVPGLPHRTGHGIGLDGHEWTNFVRGNKTRIQPGMCFSDEPTVSIYGEFGIRLEDCLYITEDGAQTFSKQSPAIDQPFG
ncbi:MAG TPA: Xaa-Pro peptidase family protein [Candidatus Acidoferrales bacterium]|jgi:Xaa-Pro dipeptidase|nr:Xaa-Pro peptidase family protein [Candidatus Acidoferrales bacterium]